MSRGASQFRVGCRHAGQTIVEFAIIAVVLFVLLFSIIQMGVVIYDYNMVCSAAREAVRYAIVHPSNTSGIIDAAINSAPFLSPGNVTVNTTVTDPNDATQQDARVTISYSYTLRIPLLPAIGLTLASSSQMVLAQ
jgi:Flp pilus assembly protein TadG